MKREFIKREFRLPNGKITTSQTRYIRAYRRLAKPIRALFPEESKYGYAFDPGLILGTLDFSSQQAIKIYELITKKKFVS